MSDQEAPEPKAVHTYYVRDERVEQFVLPGWEEFTPPPEDPPSTHQDRTDAL